jgi:hypothetical protein
VKFKRLSKDQTRRMFMGAATVLMIISIVAGAAAAIIKTIESDKGGK